MIFRYDFFANLVELAVIIVIVVLVKSSIFYDNTCDKMKRTAKDANNAKTIRLANKNETRNNGHVAIAAARCASSSSSSSSSSGTMCIDVEQKQSFRIAGGKVWYDPTMEQWPNDDYRLFVGNLGREVSDHMLCAAFVQYSSFIKARVVKNRETRMTRGCYGFVSFGNSADYLRAIKDLNGTYIGSRPMKIVKSNWKKRNINY